MDLEQFEKLVVSVIRSLGKYPPDDVNFDPVLFAKIRNVMNLSHEFLPEHRVFLEDSWNNRLRGNGRIFYGYVALSMLRYILELVEIKKTTESKIAEMKIFESANEKMKQAVHGFHNEDYPSVINNLNTALELVLKDRLEIPTTITTINTSKIIEICVKHKIGPYAYLREAKKHVCQIDNKVKHQGYSPSKIDCINSIKTMEDLISKLKSKKIKLSKKIKNKIYEGI